MSHTARPDKSLEFLDDENDDRIAVLRREGCAPGIFWMQGFKSEMTGLKATTLDEWAAETGHACTRFDYSGHGQSGGRFEEGTISRWLDQSEAVFEHATEGPQVVVGSSMGGYLALLLVRRFLAVSSCGRPGRIGGIVLIAPAWDMTERLMWARATDEAKRSILDEGVWYRPSQYGDPYPITRRLIEDGRRNLIGTASWNPGCPVEIIHGRLDPDVPFGHSELLCRSLPSKCVRLIEVPDGEHRLSRPEDLAVMLQSVARLAARLEAD